MPMEGGTSEALPLLLKALKDDEREVCVPAVGCLRKLATEQTISPISLDYQIIKEEERI